MYLDFPCLPSTVSTLVGSGVADHRGPGGEASEPLRALEGEGGFFFPTLSADIIQWAGVSNKHAEGGIRPPVLVLTICLWAIRHPLSTCLGSGGVTSTEGEELASSVLSIVSTRAGCNHQSV